jgi:hypothetical protein
MERPTSNKISEIEGDGASAHHLLQFQLKPLQKGGLGRRKPYFQVKRHDSPQKD